MVAQPDAWAARRGSAVAIDDDVPPATLPWLPPTNTDAVPPARIAARSLASDWWVYSFTQLANAEGQGDASSSATQPAPGGEDEPAPDADVDAGHETEAFDPPFPGPPFGVAPHHLLRHTQLTRRDRTGSR